MSKIRELILKHWNGILWLYAGIVVLADNTVSKLEFFLVWIAHMLLILCMVPVKKDKAGGKQ